MVLLVIDTQKAITNNKLYNFNQFELNIQKLIHTARENNIEVIFVRHDDGAGSDLTPGLPGFEIYEKFHPKETEKIFDKKVNSPFKEGSLLKYLNDKNEKDIIITGLQTEYCIDASIKCGFEHGFNIIVPNYCNTTVDNKFISAEKTYKYYNNFIWQDRYAKCISLEDTLNKMIHRL